MFLSLHVPIFLKGLRGRSFVGMHLGWPLCSAALPSNNSLNVKEGTPKTDPSQWLGADMAQGCTIGSHPPPPNVTGPNESKYELIFNGGRKPDSINFIDRE
jgi:hypothetical protein